MVFVTPPLREVVWKAAARESNCGAALEYSNDGLPTYMTLSFLTRQQKLSLWQGRYVTLDLALISLRPETA